MKHLVLSAALLLLGSEAHAFGLVDVLRVIGDQPGSFTQAFIAHELNHSGGSGVISTLRSAVGKALTPETQPVPEQAASEVQAAPKAVDDLMQ